MKIKRTYQSLASMFFTVGLICGASAAQGPGNGGGGDPCENAFNERREHIRAWINADGPRVYKITLPKGVTYEKYSETMLENFDQAKIKCVKPGDQGHPVMVDGTPKVCRFDINMTGKHITCDYFAFLDLDAKKSLSAGNLVHHEYASMSGFEQPNGDESDYTISNEIEKIVKKVSEEKETEKATEEQLKKRHQHFVTVTGKLRVK